MCDEKTKNIREKFNRFDTDKNGLIDLIEFRKLLEIIGSELNTAEAEAAFDAIDEDENGLIDFDEFSRWWKTACMD